MQTRVRAFANLRPRKCEEFRVRWRLELPLLPVHVFHPPSSRAESILFENERLPSPSSRTSWIVVDPFNIPPRFVQRYFFLFSFFFLISLFYLISLRVPWNFSPFPSLSLSISLSFIVDRGACHSGRHRSVSLFSY